MKPQTVHLAAGLGYVFAERMWAVLADLFPLHTPPLLQKAVRERLQDSYPYLTWPEGGQR